MTQIEMFPTATSSPQDTHASPFHLPGSAEAQKMTDISGHTFFPLLKESDPLGAFSRMFMGMSLWASTKCYLTWKGKATPQGRSLFQLVPLTHLTDETEFGSSPEMWATPAAADSQGTTGEGQGKSLRTDVKMWPTPRACTAMAAENIHNRVNDKNPNLETVVARTMWPTPKATYYKGGRKPETLKAAGRDARNSLPDAVRSGFWPTPAASDNRDRGHKGMPAIKRRMEKGKQLNLSMVVSETSGSLNPQWVEWLMGYPEGWTDLKD